VTTFWGNTGIIAYYDCKGNRLYSHETGANGNIITPVMWSAEKNPGVLLLYSANVKFGGLYDGRGRQIIQFPADGHPDLCCDAVDLFGDNREELLTWDKYKMYIYTQDDNPRKFDHEWERYEEYNYSNYRGEYIFEK
jgi:hypothetical protein